MKIKVIDLVISMHEGNQPKKIKFKEEYWYWGYDTYTKYECLNMTPDSQISMFTTYRLDYILDDEVEIIKEKPKKIEELHFTYKNTYGNISQHKASEIDIINKINEQSKAINYLLEKDKQL